MTDLHLEVLSEGQRAVLGALGEFAASEGFCLGGGTAMARQDRPLADLLELSGKKYATGDIAHVLMALAYFNAAESEPPLSMLWDVSWEEVKRSLEAWVTELAR